MAKTISSKNIVSKRKQNFSFNAPSARTVQLVGDFTRWQEQPVQMRKNPSGIWQASVEVEPGEHHYRFLVDGEWQDDPECALHAPNPFGSHNDIRRVA